MANKLLVSNLLALLLSSVTLSLSFEPLNMEVEALIGIRRALNDPHGVFNNWDEDSVDPCSWAMITCSPENLVIGLGAPSQSLSGTISGLIGNLTNLQQILLQNNNITGEIPVELGMLPKLQTIDLSNNDFSGIVPESLSHLTTLRYLRLNNNRLSGAFPVSLSKLPQLSFFDLSYNNLSGPVPSFPARTFNIVGNPLICGGNGSGSVKECSRTSAPMSFPSIPSLLESSQRKSKAQKLAVAMGSSLGSLALLILSVGLFLWWRKKQKHHWVLGLNDRDEEGSPAVSSAGGQLGNLRHFGLKELQVATDNFSSRNILGRGGFGDVYKGRLADGTVVAVKRLKEGGAAGEAQFRTEVEMIGVAVHRNVLRLVGFCATSGERLLVYPFMPLGSLASRLQAKPPLEWGSRRRIAVGAARGLVYLHEQCDPKIIHRDVKAANVLLDEHCEAVVGDLGLARLLDHADSHVTTAVRGTVGHIAPEYLSTGQSSDKTDVFGFGILLLELITGRRTLDFAGKGQRQVGDKHKGAMLDWVKKVYQERKLELVVDRDLGSNYDVVEVADMVQVALLCTQYLPAHRPRMAEVLRMLEGDGLAGKWAASNQPHIQLDGPGSDRYDDSGTFLAGGECYADDCHEVDVDVVEEMELSGPR